jgi:vanillate O-demethylase ferredoxin subunit
VTQTTRKWLLSFHRWTGLGFGLLFGLMSLTGASLVFRTQMEPVATPDLFAASICEAKLPLDELKAMAQAAYAQGEMEYVRILGGAGRPVLFRFNDEMTLYVDPCTGRVLGQQSRYTGLFGWLEKIHRLKFLPEGEIISGTVALIFLPMFGLGVYLWWPRRAGMMKQALKFHPSLQGWPRLMNLHKLAGIYLGAVIALSALTGLPQSFTWARSGIYSLTGSPMPLKTPTIEVVNRLETTQSYESLWQTAQNLVPSPREALLHFPPKPGQSVKMFLIDQDAPHANARSYLYLDPYSGKVIDFTAYRDGSIGHKVYFWTLSWHTAGFGGLIGQIILLLGALGGLTLAYTGMTTYIRRRKI